MDDLIPAPSALPTAPDPDAAAALAAASRAADAAAAAGALARYRAGLAPSTLRAHAADLATWVRYLAAVGVTPPPDPARLADDAAAWRGVSVGLVAGFVEWLLREGYALASVNRRLATVRAYLTQAAAAGALPADLPGLLRSVRGLGGRQGRRRAAARPVTRRSPKKAAPLLIPVDAAVRLKRQDLRTPQGARDAALLALLLDLGLRIGEVADLERADVDLERGLLQVTRRKVDRMQRLLLTNDAQVALRAYLRWRGDADGALFWRTRRDGTLIPHAPLGVRGARKRVGALGARAGVAGLSPHDCRHHWTTLAFAAGSDLAAVMEAGGWRSAAMPLRYAQQQAIANARVRLAAPQVWTDADGDAPVGGGATHDNDDGSGGHHDRT